MRIIQAAAEEFSSRIGEKNPRELLDLNAEMYFRGLIQIVRRMS
jgi:hypothetical protein